MPTGNNLNQAKTDVGAARAESNRGEKVISDF